MKRPRHVDRNGARASLRFSIIGHLLAAPPERGALDAALEALSTMTWRDPVTDAPVRFAKKTIERWYYKALIAGSDPVGRLRKKRRKDFGAQPAITEAIAAEIRRLRTEYPGWTMRLVADELRAILESKDPKRSVPSYSTLRRFMKREGLERRRKSRQRAAIDRALPPREVRRFEVDRLHALWHLDFHHGSRRVLDQEGRWIKVILLCILDDHARLVCHAQWYRSEDTEDLVHGFCQALQKRGLPRAVLSDNGSAMTSEEFRSGLDRLGIVQETTLPYHPEQNGKQERFFATIEGRLMALLSKKQDLDLAYLNLATHAWIEEEYHRTVQREMATSPLERLMTARDAARDCPPSDVLHRAFIREVVRKPSRQTATLSLHGVRFEIPPAYRHFDRLRVRYARWDLSVAWLVDEASGQSVVRIRPEDPVANAEGKRRMVGQAPALEVTAGKERDDVPALLKKYLADFAASGLPPAYLPQPEMEEPRS